MTTLGARRTSKRPSLGWLVLGVVIVVVIVMLVWVGLSRLAAPSAPSAATYWPTNGWRTSTPEEQSVDSVKLAAAVRAARQQDMHLHSLFIVRNGAVLLDVPFYPYDGQSAHDLASVTKSVMTTLVAIAAAQGKLDLDAPMVSFFPDRVIANRDAAKERITVRHLASMASGLDSVGMAQDEGTLAAMVNSPDWVQFALDRKVVSEPGTQFVYDSPGMHLLSAILQKATGMTALEFARQNLFEPLGIHDYNWESDPQGITHGWGDLFLRPQDAAKIGYLWLNKGVWDGKQLVPQQWVEDSVKVQHKTGMGDDYGYGWWITPESGTYSAEGRGGQNIKVVPSLNAIVVTTGGGFNYDALDPYLTATVGDPTRPLPPNPQGMALLEAARKAVSEPPAAQPVPPLPDTARAISGKTYALKPNPLRLRSLGLDFDGSAEATMRLTFDDGQPDRLMKVGLDGVYRMAPAEYGLPSGQRGSWLDERTFVLDYDGIANRDAYMFRMSFVDDRLIMLGRERTRSDGVMVEGQATAP
ncbi:MAG: serine hydrolase [Anaerolineae bacterium]